jgi:hypothetical protein
MLIVAMTAGKSTFDAIPYSICGGVYDSLED